MFETPTQTPISPVPPPVVRAKSSSRLGTGILALAALVAIGGVAFAGGRLTAPAAAATTAGTTGRQGFGFNGGAAGTANGGAGVANRLGGENGGVTLQGTVTAISSSSLSLKLANGTTVTIPIDSATTYHRQQAATSTEVASGATVLVEVSGFGGRGAGTAEASGGANSSAPPAACSFTPPSFDPNTSPNPNRISGQLSFGTARDITIAAQ